MSKLRLRFNVTGEDVVDDIKDAIEHGVAMSAQPVADDIEDVAQQRIREAGAIWRGVLIESFEFRVEKRGDTLRVVVFNHADQAAPIEFGAEYEEKGPPLAPLIPWVKTKMQGFQIDNSDLQPFESAEDIRARAEVEYEGESFSMDLARYTDRETLEKAFWLQQHIKEEGIDAVRYMTAAEQYAEQKAQLTVADYISRSLQRL